MITLKYKIQKASKFHVCNFCCENIRPKEEYYNSSHVYEGTVYTWKSHINCSKLTTELNMDGEEGITQEIFWEDVKNKFYELTFISGDRIPEATFKQQLDYVIEKTIKDETR